MDEIFAYQQLVQLFQTLQSHAMRLQKDFRNELRQQKAAMHKDNNPLKGVQYEVTCYLEDIRYRREDNGVIEPQMRIRFAIRRIQKRNAAMHAKYKLKEEDNITSFLNVIEQVLHVKWGGTLNELRKWSRMETLESQMDTLDPWEIDDIITNKQESKWMGDGDVKSNFLTCSNFENETLQLQGKNFFKILVSLFIVCCLESKIVYSAYPITDITRDFYQKTWRGFNKDNEEYYVIKWDSDTDRSAMINKSYKLYVEKLTEEYPDEYKKQGLTGQRLKFQRHFQDSTSRYLLIL